MRVRFFRSDHMRLHLSHVSSKPMHSHSLSLLLQNNISMFTQMKFGIGPATCSLTHKNRFKVSHSPVFTSALTHTHMQTRVWSKSNKKRNAFTYNINIRMNFYIFIHSFVLSNNNRFYFSFVSIIKNHL